MIVNNVTRYLDSNNVEYSSFSLPSEKLSAKETAAFLSIPLELVYKTIVIIPPKGKPVLCVVPGSSTVNLKSVALFLKEKKVRAAFLEEAERLTGLQAGGISPLALINNGFKVIFDSSINSSSEIFLSGGQRGLIIKIKSADLLRILLPSVASIST